MSYIILQYGDSAKLYDERVNDLHIPDLMIFISTKYQTLLYINENVENVYNLLSLNYNLFCKLCDHVILTDSSILQDFVNESTVFVTRDAAENTKSYEFYYFENNGILANDKER